MVNAVSPSESALHTASREVQEVGFVRVDTRHDRRQDRSHRSVGADKIRPQADIAAWEVSEVLMGAVWKRGRRRDYLSDALSQLSGWVHEGDCLKRTLPLDDTEHAVLTEHISVAADTFGVRPHIRRLDGRTQIQLCAGDNGTLTSAEIGMAARVEAAYQSLNQ
ncbi:4a-hydroxytetrahydrobiopterin dehydratase [Catellatospora vulcania]|uniref:4a-hydroxytetrahydrobiopterin dehydratase n=1 Tax=Catellatospora vulcania TaxID=1460450 RepID=UPI001E42C1E2|nr:4a-hydroxytetrahydrobiopterin dehydratase [Catellatospora vulcania]